VLDADRDETAPARPAAGRAGHEQRPDARNLDAAGEHHHVAGERRERGSGNADEQGAHLASAPISIQEEDQPCGCRRKSQRGAGEIQSQQIGDPGDRCPQRGLDAAGAVEERRLHGHQRDRRGDTDPRDDPCGQRLPRPECEDDDRRRHERGGYQRQLEPTAQHRAATSRYGPAPALRPLWRSTGRPPSRGAGCGRTRCTAGQTGSGSTGRE
jgi:hypothetical protein